jgi:hypothetical protein
MAGGPISTSRVTRSECANAYHSAHTAPAGVADERGGVESQRVEHVLQSGDSSVSVAIPRLVNRVASVPGPVGGRRADPVELVQQR